MKAKIYLRVARHRGAAKVAATVRPNYYPLEATVDGAATGLPTAMFALELDIPDEVLRRAEHIAAKVTLDADAGQVIVAPLTEEPPE